MSGNFSARTNSQTGFSAATRRSLPQHARLGTASSLTRPALPQSEPASGPSSIMIKGGWYNTPRTHRAKPPTPLQFYDAVRLGGFGWSGDGGWSCPALLLGLREFSQSADLLRRVSQA